MINDFEKMMALAAENHFKENCSVGNWCFDIFSENSFVIAYNGESVVVCNNNQITDAKWGSRIAGVEVYDILKNILENLPSIQLDLMSIRTDEGFSLLGFDGPSLPIADIPGMEDIDYYRAWVTSKSNMINPEKKDHIVYWDQGNTWCEVLAVFQGVTHEEFVSKMHEKYNQWIQEEVDLGDIEDTMPSLTNQLQSTTTRALDSQRHSIVKGKTQEFELEI